MKESFKWLSRKEASEFLRVDEQILDLLMREGYLKPGLHWRSSTDSEQVPWKPKVFYCIDRCKEFIDSLKDNASYLDQIAA